MAVLTAALLVLASFSEPTDELVALAAEANVEPVQLEGAVNTTQLAPRTYLEMTGELSQPRASAPVSTVWDRLAQCESNGRWHIDAYHDGGLQFLPSTWTAYGGGQYARYAWQATREQQIAIAQKVQAAAGWLQWPTCARRLGLAR